MQVINHSYWEKWIERQQGICAAQEQMTLAWGDRAPLSSSAGKLSKVSGVLDTFKDSNFFPVLTGRETYEALYICITKCR